METEDLSRYKDFPKLNTNKTINNPPGVIAGRTMGECCLTMVLFFGLSYADYTMFGLLISALYFYLSVKIREKYPRAIIQHVMYGIGIFGNDKKKVFWKELLTKIGLYKKEDYNPPAYFSIHKKISMRRS